MYPIAIKQRARQLAKLGIQKTAIPNILRVSYPSIVRWTSDIASERGRVSGRYFQLLCRLINDGFILMRRKDLKIYRILKRDTDVRSLVFGKIVLFFIRGREAVAERALIPKSKDLSKRKLNMIRLVFTQNKRPNQI